MVNTWAIGPALVYEVEAARPASTVQLPAEEKLSMTGAPDDANEQPAVLPVDDTE
jgi:hypothetical protein